MKHGLCCRSMPFAALCLAAAASCSQAPSSEEVHKREEQVHKRIDAANFQLQSILDNLQQIEELRSNALSRIDFSARLDTPIPLPALVFESLGRDDKSEFHVQIRVSIGNKQDFDICKRFVAPYNYVYPDWSYNSDHPEDFAITIEARLAFHFWRYAEHASYRSNPFLGMKTMAETVPRFIDFTQVKSIVVIATKQQVVGTYMGGGNAEDADCCACVLSYPDLIVIAGTTIHREPPGTVRVPRGTLGGGSGYAEAHGAIDEWITSHMAVQ